MWHVQPRVPPLASGHLLWPSPHPCTCMWSSRGNASSFLPTGRAPGASAGQTDWKKFPFLRRVNPGVPDTRQPPCRGAEARWRTEASAGHCPEQIPIIPGTPHSKGCLPNKKRPRGLGGTSQKPRGRPQSTTPHHDGPQSLPHFHMSTRQRSVWLTSASHRHLAWEKPPS